MNEQVVLHVTMEAVPGHEDELKDHLTALVSPTRSEPGCIEYILHRNPEHPGTFMFYERFVNQAALDAHIAMPYFQNFVQYRAAANPDPVAKVVVTRWQQIA
jgi:quinol monooxygenase YgiN